MPKSVPTTVPTTKELAVGKNQTVAPRQETKETGIDVSRIKTAFKMRICDSL
jgi:hypothetical protein